MHHVLDLEGTLLQDIQIKIYQKYTNLKISDKQKTSRQIQQMKKV